MDGAKGCGLEHRRVEVLAVPPLMISSKEQLNHHLLPEDIIINEILTRLPVKSLLKFRCVCKLWFSLISSSQFIRSHLIKSSNSSNFIKHRASIYAIDVTTHKYTSYMYLFNSIVYDLTSPMNAIKQVDIRTNARQLQTNIHVGSCNGLVCVSRLPNRYTIFNPALKKFHKLQFHGNLSPNTYTHGFGYDEVNDDYKVVILTTQSYNKSKIYSFKNNCWRSLKDHQFGDFSSSLERGVFVSGKLYWAKYGSKCNKFLTLDMVTEEFGKVAHLKHGYGDGETVEWVLLESRGCLYSFAHVHNKDCMDVWEMKEHGVEDHSWTKLGSIPSIIDNCELSILYPFFVIENSVVLLHTDTSVILYSLKYSKVVGHKLYGGPCFFVGFQPYIESLVPPYLDGGDNYTMLTDFW